VISGGLVSGGEGDVGRGLPGGVSGLWAPPLPNTRVPNREAVRSRINRGTTNFFTPSLPPLFPS